MAVLGIESSAHTLGIGIVSNGKVLANEKLMYPIGKAGMIPRVVARFHEKNFERVLDTALSAASMTIDQIDAIGYTKGPGIGSCLQIGQRHAIELARKYRKPLYDVNHAVAHIEVTKDFSGMRNPLALYVSGGNSQILALEGKHNRRYHVYGETFDIGVGNMLDGFARAAGMNPAWGSTVAKRAIGGRYIEMPYTVKGMDFAFTGLLTNAIKALGTNSIRDVSYSLQETAFSMLCEATERALLLTGKKELALCGGVAQSRRLRQMLAMMARAHGARLGVADDQYNADNGAMIALVAERMFENKARWSLDRCTVKQRYRIEDAVISW